MNSLHNITQAFKFGTNIAPRAILAVAATLYCLTVLLAPVYSGPADEELARAAIPHVYLGQVMHLSPPQMYLIGGFFALDGLLLWWRLFDPAARLWMARLVNYFTACLWVTIAGATIWAYGWFLPAAVGEVMLALISLHALSRTDYTDRDRETA